MKEQKILKLYKTDENHSSGLDVFRVIGTKEQSNQYGLVGEFFIGDKEEMYSTSGKPYMDDYGCFDKEASYRIYHFIVIE